MATVYLGLGSNIGQREQYLHQAIMALEQQVGMLLKCSSFIETIPWGFTSNHVFLNAVLSMHTLLSPQLLLKVTQGIEKAFGRSHKSIKGQYADRTIDIDILFYDDMTMASPSLTIPHPLLHRRIFVLHPLCEIAPHLRHPQLGMTVSQLYSRLLQEEDGASHQGRAVHDLA
ncbi:MAG: 2-amino-4-hydroxy-6-hydroxymethyldihydropteridine diphosphokinase [Bacteroidaceae bacterium]|nr:2-amino-4-hydroxy-6-hydroxymethyldihydropteridine diphosphokinase [Bacteroidaceae bacterium]